MSLDTNLDTSKEEKEELGRLIAEKIKRENPDLVRDLRKTMKNLLNKYRKPWYARTYERIKDFFYS